MKIVLRLSRLALSCLMMMLVWIGCATAPAQLAPEETTPVIGSLKFLESFPEETNLNLAEFPEAYLIWPSVFNDAEKSIEQNADIYSCINGSIEERSGGN